MMNRFPRYLSRTLVGILLAMPIWPFASTWMGSVFGFATVWKSLPTIVLVVFGFATLLYLIFYKRKLLRDLFRDRLIVAIIIFAVIVLISLLMTEATRRAQLAGVAMDLRYFIGFILAFISVKLDPKFWRKVLSKLPIVAISIGVVLAVAGLIQVMILPSDFLTHFGYGVGTIAPSITIDDGEVLRAFATLRGPNDYAAFLIIPLLLSIWRFIKKQNGWYLAAALTIVAGIFVSSSRSAWIGAMAAILTIVAVSLLPAKIYRQRKFWLTVSGAIASLAVAGLLLIQIPYVKLHVLHIDDDRGSSITSNSAHVEALKNGLQNVVDNPLGCGVGCAGPASFYSDDATISENYYLQIAEQYGVIGVLLWFGIVGVIVSRIWPHRRNEIGGVWLAALVGYLLIGVLLHVFADEPLALVWFVIAGVLIGLSQKSLPKHLAKK